jgi:hypothetical protein
MDPISQSRTTVFFTLLQDLFCACSENSSFLDQVQDDSDITYCVKEQEARRRDFENKTNKTLLFQPGEDEAPMLSHLPSSLRILFGDDRILRTSDSSHTSETATMNTNSFDPTESDWDDLDDYSIAQSCFEPRVQHGEDIGDTIDKAGNSQGKVRFVWLPP